VLVKLRRRRFVGRSAEIELFRAALEDATDPPFSLLHVHGPGGGGKSSLVQAFGAIAADAGATVARLDGRDLEASPPSVLEALGEVLAIPADGGPIAPAPHPTDVAIGRFTGPALCSQPAAARQSAPVDHPGVPIVRCRRPAAADAR
jgi:hypothetical protein